MPLLLKKFRSYFPSNKSNTTKVISILKYRQIATLCAPSMGIPVLLIGIIEVNPLFLIESIKLLKLLIKSFLLFLLPSGSKKVIKTSNVI